MTSLVADKRHPLNSSPGRARVAGNPYFFVQRGLPFLTALHSRVVPFESCAVVPTAVLEQNCPVRGSFGRLGLRHGRRDEKSKGESTAMRRMGTSDVDKGRDGVAQHNTWHEQSPVYGFVI